MNDILLWPEEATPAKGGEPADRPSIPEKHVTRHTPLAFLWMTANDAKVPVQHNLLFAAALAEHKVPFEMHIFEEGLHGLGIAKDHPSVGQWTELCRVWLKRQGF
jgi:dipeptidyl aminopeptidase/acylaminoacyl peptidase